MPVSTSPLPKYAFSKNAINVEMVSDDFLSNEGAQATFRIIFPGAVPANHQTRLLWASGDVTLTAAIVPDTSGNQYPAGPGGEAYVKSVMAALNRNYYITRDFTLSYLDFFGSPSITGVAKNKGILYNVTPVGDSVVTVAIAYNGLNRELKRNFEHHLEVWLVKPDGDINVYDNNLSLEPGTGKTVKDISDILNVRLSPKEQSGSDRPDLLAASWQVCQSSFAAYYVKTAQYFGEAPVVGIINQSDNAFVNLGGLDIQAAFGKTMLEYLVPDGDQTKTLCLRQGGKNIKVSTEQPEWLYWINLSDVAVKVRIKVELICTDGNEVPLVLLPFTAPPNTKCYVPVSYQALSIGTAIPAGKLLSYYSVRIINDTGEYLSAPYNYVPDRYREHPRYFVYRNSLGGFQTLYTWGVSQQVTTLTKEDFKTQVTSDQAAVYGMITETNIRFQDSRVVYTGYRSVRDIDLLKDFFASEEKFVVDSGRLVPIGVEADEFTGPKDGDNLNGASFTYKPLYDQRVYTDDLAQSDSLIDGSGAQTATRQFNGIIDDGQNDDDTFYDETILD
jgi:hypothetical protein